MKIGFIGTGVMGRSLVKHLLKAGHTVYIYNRTKAKASSLLDDGAVWSESPKEVALQSDVIMTMVGYPTDVEEVYLSDNGLIANAQAGTLMIDLTTSTPSLAKRIDTEAKAKGLKVLDAPVSGGDNGAKAGTLSIMCGGDEADFQLALPLLQLFGKNILLQGAAGSGQHTKMCNQIAIASTIMGTCEAITYAKAAGLQVEQVMASISKGAARSWQLENNGQKIIDEDFEPGFYIKHFIKDMKIALDEAKLMKLDLPGLKLANSLYEELAKGGKENLGTQALIYWYKQNQS